MFIYFFLLSIYYIFLSAYIVIVENSGKVEKSGKIGMFENIEIDYKC